MIENGKKVQYEGYTTDIITDLALDWLDKKRDNSKPFLLMYQHKAPHREWEPSPKFLHKYDGEQIPEPPTLFDDYSGRGSAAKMQKMMVARDLNERDLKFVPPKNLTPEQLKTWNAGYEPKNEEFKKMDLKGDDLVRWKYQRYIKDYLRCVAALDENLGRVLDYLDETGLANNTIVVYSSDQGWYLGDHGWFDKRWMYEESLHTPLIVRWPENVKAGTVDTHLVSNLDFAETFLDLAGVDIPGNMQGRSLVPLLKSESPDDWRDSFYYHYYEYPGTHSVQRHYGVRDDRYKLIYFYQIAEWELYDLAKDPHELRSCYNDPQYAEVAKQMHHKLDRLRELVQETNDSSSKFLKLR
jgi:arylsulfatase A-like enzyme